VRLSELLGLQVFDRDGERLGTAEDLRLVQDGPMTGPYAAALRVSGIIVVERRHHRLLGYERDVGPAIIRMITRSITGDVTFVPWEDVQRVDDQGVHVGTAKAECRQLHELPDRRSPAATE